MFTFANIHEALEPPIVSADQLAPNRNTVLNRSICLSRVIGWGDELFPLMKRRVRKYKIGVSTYRYLIFVTSY
jgi:hypothetical protein